MADALPDWRSSLKAELVSSLVCRTEKPSKAKKGDGGSGVCEREEIGSASHPQNVSF